MEKMLCKIANSFAMSTGIEFEDLLQESRLAYLESLTTYDQSRGKLTTHVWHCVSNHLKNYVKKNSFPSTSLDGIEREHSATPFWERLSKDGMIIADIVLASPKPFLELGKTNSPSKLKEILLENDWDKKRIRRGLSELKMAFSS